MKARRFLVLVSAHVGDFFCIVLYGLEFLYFQFVVILWSYLRPSTRA